MGVVDQKKFVKIISEKIIRHMIPEMFTEVFSNNAECMAAAVRCETGTREAADFAAMAAGRAVDDARRIGDLELLAGAEAAESMALFASQAATCADNAICTNTSRSTRNTTWSATSAGRVAMKCTTPKFYDKYLRMTAEIGLETLKELKSPGVEWLKFSNDYEF